MTSNFINWINCPLSCGYSTPRSNYQSKIICHLKQNCPKRLLLDEDIIICEDGNDCVLITNLEKHRETCHKCGNNLINNQLINDTCNTGNSETIIREDYSTYELNKYNDRIIYKEKSIIMPYNGLCKSKLQFNKVYNEEISHLTDSADIKTNYSSRNPSVNDTMIARRVVEKKINKSPNSFYDISNYNQRSMKGNTRNKNNDTMCEEESFVMDYENYKNIRSSYPKYIKFKRYFSLTKSNYNYNQNMNDTMIMDHNGYYPSKSIINDCEEENEEDPSENNERENFYFDGEIEQEVDDDFKEYFIN